MVGCSIRRKSAAGAVLLGAALALTARPVHADATAFLGVATAPEARRVTGVAIGSGLVVLGFEFEYAQTQEQLESGSPALRTFMGNLLVQTPVPIHGIQFYGTVGGGLYRETLAEDHQETSVGTNLGGGAKITLAGPVRLRLDYRAFVLRGSPIRDKIHRFYAGLNLAF